MQIIELELVKTTKNYKYVHIQYSPWFSQNVIKSKSIFIHKKTNDCFWQNTGKRLIASTERAVLALVEFEEEMALIGAIKRPGRVDRELNDKFNSVLDQIIYTKS